MPIYEYRCDNGHTFEVLQSMADPPVAACRVCGAAVQQVFHPIAVHFKGSGFYTTDYARKGAKKAEVDGASANGDSKAADAKPSDSKSGDSKSGSDSKSGDSKSKSASKSSSAEG